MKRKSNFVSTRLSGVLESLTAAYGNDEGGRIFNAAQSILRTELAGVNDRGNRMIGKHIRRNILPGYACYRAMLDSGICSSEAVEFVRIELCKRVESMAKLSKGLSSKKYTYWMIRAFMRVILKYGFPKQGWNAVIHENSKDRIQFDMTNCLYCEELQKRGALELCPAFCYTDVVSYSPLAPAVVFKRQNTLAQSGVKCDFCFEKGAVSRKRYDKGMA
jgi:hypothetical protein